jgi:signal transduction histidine kinase
MVSVSDNGPDSLKTTLSMVFTRYYQMEHQRKEFLSWETGIGLYYSDVLPKTHHGYIKSCQ